MQPQVKDLHIDAALSNVSVMYKNADLMGEKIFPVITVQKDTDTYFIYGKQNLRLYNDLRAPGTIGERFEWTVATSTSYALVEHSLYDQLIDEVRDNADDPIRYDSDSVEMVTEALLLRIEADVATFANSGSYYAATNSSTPTTGWDVSTSDPIGDVDSAKDAVRQLIFRKPNTMVVSEAVHKVLRTHPKLLDLFKYTAGGTVTVDQIKSALEIKNYIVYGAGKISSAEGQTTETIAQLWGKNVAILYVAENPGLKQLSFAYVFRKKGYRLVERWREDKLRSDFVRVSDKYQIYSVAPTAGYLLQGVIA